MKKILLSALVLFPVLLSAQGFRYDTIPAPQKSSTKGFRYEIPPSSTSASTPVREQQTQAAATQAQKRQSGFDLSRLEIGGNLGLGFGNDYASVNISPQVGYAFSGYFTAGLGLSYNYYRWNDPYIQTQNYLGGNLYARFSPVSFIHLQVQPELYGMWGRAGGRDIPSQMVPACLVGGGITLPLGGRGGVTAMLFYDVVQNERSPYGGQLVYSLGYTFRL